MFRQWKLFTLNTKLHICAKEGKLEDLQCVELHSVHYATVRFCLKYTHAACNHGI